MRRVGGQARGRLLTGAFMWFLTGGGLLLSNGVRLAAALPLGRHTFAGDIALLHTLAIHPLPIIRSTLQVYGIITLQLACTALVAAAITSSVSVQHYLSANWG